jgi:hypothetical protein
MPNFKGQREQFRSGFGTHGVAKEIQEKVESSDF